MAAREFSSDGMHQSYSIGTFDPSGIPGRRQANTEVTNLASSRHCLAGERRSAVLLPPCVYKLPLAVKRKHGKLFKPSQVDMVQG